MQQRRLHDEIPRFSLTPIGVGPIAQSLAAEKWPVQLFFWASKIQQLSRA